MDLLHDARGKTARDKTASARPRRRGEDEHADAFASPHAKRSLTVSRPALLEAGSDRAFRQFVHDMLAFAARIQEVRSRLGRAIGLAGQKYTVLIAIAHLQDRAGGVGINEIAEHLHLSGAFVTIETNGLIRSGLVAKRTNPQDRRRVLLTITPKAADLLDRLTELQAPVNNALFRTV
jgi:MarR family transcriptional regulator, organic hydroperoxide resistance regulator